MLCRMSRPLALVTGPTSGIGLAFAHQLAAAGHDLVLVSRNRERLERLAAEVRERYGADAEVMVADLGRRDELAPVEARLADTGRPVDLLVNNAGLGLKDKFLDNPVEDEQYLLDVLVTAVLRLTHAALGQMVARGSGAVVNVSSIAGYLPRGSYSAAKSYVTSLSEWADLTYRDQGVRVMALCPGFTKTEFHQRMEVRRGDGFMWLDADFLVERALADHAKGRVFSVPGAQYRTVVALSRAVPTGLLQRFQSIGRR
jgi:uncharacterized protein